LLVRHGLRALIPSMITIALLAGCVTTPPVAEPDRIASIQSRGYVNCGLAPDVPGFSVVGEDGSAAGFDADLCRAVAAALLGSRDRVRFTPVATITEFLASDDIDLVFHGLTWKWERELKWGVRFGPVTYFDGQAFLVLASSPVLSARDLRGPICVQAGTPFERNLARYLEDQGLGAGLLAIEGLDETRQGFLNGRCEAWSWDASTLGASLAGAAASRFRILGERISNEPLAPVLRKEDAKLQHVVRWTVQALVTAEALGATKSNIDQLPPGHPAQEIVRAAPSEELHLANGWARRAVAAGGNYEELYERHFGGEDWVAHERGFNRIWLQGGVIHAPPFGTQ
jgi:general L-amino acid transport system substrate-binding protein